MLLRTQRRCPAILWHDVVGSTQEVAQALWTGLPPRAVVGARAQTAGRGRGGRPWRSPPGNVYLSCTVPGLPCSPADLPTFLPWAMALAVGDVLARYGVPSSLKWPNDVRVEGRKVAGILVETVSGARGVEGAVVGVGVNVGMGPDELSRIDQPATSLRALGVEADPQEVAEALVEGFWSWLGRGPGPVRGAAWARMEFARGTPC